MAEQCVEIHGTPTLLCADDGSKLRAERDAQDLIGDALAQGARLVVVPAERLDPDFFVLRTRVAGNFLQKLVSYRLRVAVLGDIARHLEQSAALRDFVYESNRGTQIWFVATLDELADRLAQIARPES